MTAAPELRRDEVSISEFPGDRDTLRELFALAEDSTEQLEGYLGVGRVLVARIDTEIAGHLQVVSGDDASALEIKNMAVLVHHRRRGVGSALIAAVRRDALALDLRRLVVSTAAADTDNLQFYQRNGFRLLRVERDAFTPATGYLAGIEINGIPLRDRVWLDLSLTESS
jgi:GNAT superfamily N-acetyltransferase